MAFYQDALDLGFTRQALARSPKEQMCGVADEVVAFDTVLLRDIATSSGRNSRTGRPKAAQTLGRCTSSANARVCGRGTMPCALGFSAKGGIKRMGAIVTTKQGEAVIVQSGSTQPCTRRCAEVYFWSAHCCSRHDRSHRPAAPQRVSHVQTLHLQSSTMIAKK